MSKKLLGIGLVLAAAAAFGLQADPSDTPQSPPSPPPPDDHLDDETALARMLASETSSPGARVVVGWTTVERARRAGRSVLKQILGSYATYGAGPGKRRGTYASTAWPPTAQTRDLAKKLLAGTLLPSAEIRAKGPGSWVEQDQGLTDDRLLALQKDFGGIWARIEGTRWYLYSQKDPDIFTDSGESARQRLARVRTVPALDVANALVLAAHTALYHLTGDLQDKSPQRRDS